jgi:hypothetical protein
MDEQDTQDFGSRSELFLRSVFEYSLQAVPYLFASHFLSLAFQFQWHNISRNALASGS